MGESKMKLTWPLSSRRAQPCQDEGSHVYVGEHTHIPSHYNTAPVKIQTLRELGAWVRLREYNELPTAIQWFLHGTWIAPPGWQGLSSATQGPQLMEMPFVSTSFGSWGFWGCHGWREGLKNWAHLGNVTHHFCSHLTGQSKSHSQGSWEVEGIAWIIVR